MRIPLLGLVALPVLGCAITELPVAQSLQESDSSSVPTSSGIFLGHDQVPTSSDLEAAATFNLADVKWSVLNGVATLHYDLPVGLVGGDLAVTLSGPIASGATSVTLTAAN